MHARISGLSDYLATDERDAIRLGRQILARINWRKLGPAAARPGHAAAATTRTSCSASCPADVRVPVDPREMLARIVDGSGSTSTSPCTAPGWSRAGPRSTATRWGSWPTNAGSLFSEEAKKAAEFIQLANQTDTPLVFLQNTTGYMVGAATSRAASSRTAPR